MVAELRVSQEIVLFTFGLGEQAVLLGVLILAFVAHQATKDLLKGIVYVHRLAYYSLMSMAKHVIATYGAPSSVVRAASPAHAPWLEDLHSAPYRPRPGNLPSN